MSGQNELKSTTEASRRDALIQLLVGYRYSISIYIAAKLGIADLLKDGPKTCDEMARVTETNPGGLYRMLRVLASEGVFVEAEHGRFELTPQATFLRSDVPESMRPWAILIGELMWRPWSELMYSVKTGKPAFDRVYGMGLFEYLAKNPRIAETFDATMASGTGVAAAALTSAYDFSGMNVVTDVGGGNGALIAAILKSNPHIHGILFEQPAVIERAENLLEADGLANRCELVPGDFFESVPRGGDAYILKFILHDWDDERAIAILKTCHRAMEERSKLLVIEQLIPPGNEPSFTKLLDLQMLVMVTGCERTEADYRALFASAGFRMTRVIPTQSLYSLLEGVRE